MRCTISMESEESLIVEIIFIVNNKSSVDSFLIHYFDIFEAVYKPIMFLRKSNTAGSCMSCSFFSFSTIVRMSGCFSMVLSGVMSCSPSLLLLAGCGVVGVRQIAEVVVDVGVNGVALGIFDDVDAVVVALVDDTAELMLSELLLIAFLVIRPFLGLLAVLAELTKGTTFALVGVGFTLTAVGTAILGRTASRPLSDVVSDDCRRRFTCKFKRSFIVSVSISNNIEHYRMRCILIFIEIYFGRLRRINPYSSNVEVLQWFIMPLTQNSVTIHHAQQAKRVTKRATLRWS